VADLRQERPTDEDEGLNGQSPGPESKGEAGDLAELHRLLEELRTVAARLLTDFSDLARSQWRLTSYVLAGNARIAALRMAAFAILGVLVIAVWVFGNVAVWRAVGELETYAFTEPLALVLLNSILALFIFLWQKGLKLK